MIERDERNERDERDIERREGRGRGGVRRWER